MLEIEQLERDWKRYRRKKRLPYVAGGILFLMIGSTSLFFLNETHRGPSHTSKTDVIQPRTFVAPQKKSEPLISFKVDRARQTTPIPRTTSTNKAPEQISQKSSTTVSKPTRKKIKIEADTSFLNTLNVADARYTISSPKKTNRITQKTTKKVFKEPPKTTSMKMDFEPQERAEGASRSLENKVDRKEKPIVKEVSHARQNNTLTISTKKTNNTLKYLIERFNTSRDPKLASYIAQSYYKKGEYKETIKWAIVANSIEPSSEENWILFAKAKVKLGKKRDAIKALRIFLNQYPSKKVKSYLQTLETGL
jgi:hypothetical protein